jgi:hypothetical protein
LLAVHNGLFSEFTLGLHTHADHLLYPQAENVPCYNDKRLNTALYLTLLVPWADISAFAPRANISA